MNNPSLLKITSTGSLCVVVILTGAAVFLIAFPYRESDDVREFRKVKVGMTIKEVTATLGKPVVHVSSPWFYHSPVKESWGRQNWKGEIVHVVNDDVGAIMLFIDGGKVVGASLLRFKDEGESLMDRIRRWLKL
jgi:hypothetical protein